MKPPVFALSRCLFLPAKFAVSLCKGWGFLSVELGCCFWKMDCLCFSSWWQRFVLVIKRVSPHDKKGLRSWWKAAEVGTRRFFFLFERFKISDFYDEIGVCCVCAGALGLASLFAAVFERPTLRGCQRWATLCRVKAHRTLTLPCQKTNPDGVIWDGKRLEMVVCGNRIEFDGVIWGANEWRMGFRRSMDNLQWAFVGGKYWKMAMEAWGNGFQKING